MTPTLVTKRKGETKRVEKDGKGEGGTGREEMDGDGRKGNEPWVKG